MRELTREEKQRVIAKNVAKLFDEDPEYRVVNLGVGIPTMVSSYVTREDVTIMAENGMLGVGPLADGEHAHPDLINAGRQSVLETKGCWYTDSAEAFGLIRGGHIDATVLGAFEVDSEGNVANWIIPGGKQLGVGGAMDLVIGARQVIIAMTHTGKSGTKLVPRCTLPLTARGKVRTVVTEYAVFRFDAGKIVLSKIAPYITLDELRSVTGVEFEVSADLAEMVE